MFPNHPICNEADGEKPMSTETARALWNRIDKLKGKTSLKELAEKSGLNGSSLQVMKSKDSLPSMNVVYPLAQSLGTTMEYLYKGVEENRYSDNPIFSKLSSNRLLSDIASRLADATPEEVEMVRRILEIPRPSDER